MRKTHTALGLLAVVVLALSGCAPVTTSSPSSLTAPVNPLGEKGEVDRFLRFALGPLIAQDIEAILGFKPEIGYTPEVARCLYGRFGPVKPSEAVRWVERAKAFQAQSLGLLAYEGHTQALLGNRGTLLAFVRLRPFSGGSEREVGLVIRLVPSPSPMPWGNFCPETAGGFPRIKGNEVSYPDLLALYRAAYEGGYE